MFKTVVLFFPPYRFSQESDLEAASGGGGDDNKKTHKPVVWRYLPTGEWQPKQRACLMLWRCDAESVESAAV